jgi:hypothetical protein
MLSFVRVPNVLWATWCAGRFMIKTQTPEENKFLRKILPHYYQYVSLNPDTLLTRFYGMHRVKMRHLKRKVRARRHDPPTCPHLWVSRKLANVIRSNTASRRPPLPTNHPQMHFVIMHSVFDTKERIYRIYDLKGSTVGRSSGPSNVRKEGVVYKDLDLVDDKVRIIHSMAMVVVRKVRREPGWPCVLRRPAGPSRPLVGGSICARTLCLVVTTLLPTQRLTVLVVSCHARVCVCVCSSCSTWGRSGSCSWSSWRRTRPSWPRSTSWTTRCWLAYMTGPGVCVCVWRLTQACMHFHDRRRTAWGTSEARGHRSLW